MNNNIKKIEYLNIDQYDKLLELLIKCVYKNAKI